MNKEQYYKLYTMAFLGVFGVFLIANFVFFKINWLFPILVFGFGLILLLVVKFYLKIENSISKIQRELGLSKAINGETDRWNIDEETGEKKYYSQCGQDKWIIEEVFDYKKNGFFLDLGGADGIDISNTYILEKKYGWKGICIECEDSLFEKLKSNRNCTCVHACIDDYSKKTIKFTKNRGLIGGIIDQDTDNKGFINTNEFDKKETFALAEILDKYNAPKVIDYFSLDVEGAEHRIFRDFPFDKYKFLAMSIERPNEDLVKTLRKNGYIKVGANEFDKLFIHETFNQYK